MKKQDSNGVRTPLDVERRHNLGAIPKLEEEVSEFSVDNTLSSSSTHPVENKVITAALTGLNANKVDKEADKGLSSNDFTNSDKASIHTHSNKTVIDTITQQKIDQWDANSNQDVYSFTEILTNKVWVDGKPIYRKVYEQSSVLDIDVSDLNIDKMVDIRMIWNKENEITVDFNNYYYNSSDYMRAFYRKSQDIVRVVSDTGGGTTSFTIILEYTKTTDV